MHTRILALALLLLLALAAPAIIRTPGLLMPVKAVKGAPFWYCNRTIRVWADVQAWITSQASQFLPSEAKLSMGMQPSGSAAAGTPIMQVSWPIPPATLETFLRSEIPTLPALGDYEVTLTPG